MLKLADYDRPPDPRKIVVIKEALRRAQWNATHGPPYVRAGQYRPETVMHQTNLNSQNHERMTL